MESGVFGAFDPREPDRKRLARRILDRELGLGDVARRRTNKQLMAQSMIPITRPEMIIHYDDPVCCGQFSDDGNFFYAAAKDFKVRMYDTSRPYNWKHYKTVSYPFGQWTLTDANLSPDNKWLAYTSLQSNVCLAPTDPNDTGDPYTLDLGDMGIQHNTYRGAFPIFSIRFSGDGRNLVAGTGTSSIVVYDIERRQTLHHVPGHQDDVNAVCFADKLSPHVLYSGSDDCTIKVWDTRSLGDGREAGAFVGHIEGLTYIDSKGDGRYILSNGKDQSMKLWDLRMAMSTARFEELDPMRAIRGHNYEYRWEDYDNSQWFRHPNDNSLVTFRGHKVQRTLIRCHFSPPGSTNSRYVYSGSYDGHVYVWNLDATLAAKINVKAVTENVRLGARPPRRRYRVHHWGNEGWETLVRDVGWHPNAPLLVGEFVFYFLSFPET
jgi:DDB1- and CUL4-associated factor 11